jgi:uncharacterized membrane protein YeaQ/YmgE (transglycosylase-associated protein family)
MLGSLVSVALSGFLIGSLARLALPGPDPMPFWFTALVGLAGSLVGGSIAAAVYGARHTFDDSNHAFVTLLLEIGAAALILALYRRFVQRRPLTGPDARRFPSRGLGIERLRGRLRRMGIDPDHLQAAEPVRTTPDDVAHELEDLRRQRDDGAITEEEYDAARERLRRY